MFGFRALAVIVLSGSMLAGCISPKSFVDPSVQKVSYDDLTKRVEPLKLKLSVEFQRNGQPYPRVNSVLKDNSERVLRGTGVIVPANDDAAGEVKITVNNIADVGAAAAKGFGTGLTFGLAGSTVMDAYEMTITITANGKTASRSAIKHALYTAIGNTTLPAGVETVPPNVAFERVLEQMILRALQDLQKSGELAHKHVPAPLPWHLVAQG